MYFLHFKWNAKSKLRKKMQHHLNTRRLGSTGASFRIESKHCLLILLLSVFLTGCPATAVQNVKNIPPAAQRDYDYDAGTEEAQAIFAGGCFWCTEAVFEEIEGVTGVVSGYSGGSEEMANYGAVCAGVTKHAEAIRITFNPQVVSYGKLLQVFMTMHDPTQPDGQHPDYGQQYRSAIFYKNEEEKAVAEAYIQQLNASKYFDKPIATSLEPLTGFYPAEDYHQDYVQHNPNDPYVQQWAVDKIAKVKKLFPR